MKQKPTTVQHFCLYDNPPTLLEPTHEHTHTRNQHRRMNTKITPIQQYNRYNVSHTLLYYIYNNTHHITHNSAHSHTHTHHWKHNTHTSPVAASDHRSQNHCWICRVPPLPCVGVLGFFFFLLFSPFSSPKRLRATNAAEAAANPLLFCTRWTRANCGGAPIAKQPHKQNTHNQSRSANAKAGDKLYRSARTPPQNTQYFHSHTNLYSPKNYEQLPICGPAANIHSTEKRALRKKRTRYYNFICFFQLGDRRPIWPAFVTDFVEWKVPCGSVAGGVRTAATPPTTHTVHRRCSNHSAL